MIINFGDKHKGESVAEVLINDPSYVDFVLKVSDSKGPLKVARDEMLILISRFDLKPFLQKCWGNNHNCGKTAIRATAYKEDYTGLYWWCKNCNPYQSGARSGTLHTISTYKDALEYVYMVLNNSNKDSAALIKQLAQEKGLPKRISKGDIEKFFLEEGILTF
jgi:hypothetical protein